MSNTTKFAIALFLVLATPAASFARGGGGSAAAGHSGSAAAGTGGGRATDAAIGTRRPGWSTRAGLETLPR
jgi:hypothetical protein